MAGGIGQYLKDTRAELRHVAWPTRFQTIIYTVLVALISIGVAAYLGFFDFVFTTGLTRALTLVPAPSPITVSHVTTSSAAPLVQGNQLTLVPPPTPSGTTQTPAK